jgi:hypothetical protein
MWQSSGIIPAPFCWFHSIGCGIGGFTGWSMADAKMQKRGNE